jgi:hypothetical protein
VLVDFLHMNRDIFAWKPSDMPGILREVAEQALKITPSSKPVKQHLCHFDEQKCRAIARRLQSFWQPDSSRKCITLSGQPILFLY